MDVTSIGSTSAVSSVTTTAAQPTPVDDASLPDAARTTISPEGGLFGQLADLAQTDPAKFKKATAEIAEKLKQAAGEASGDRAKFLGQLADRFDQAAQSGDPSVLKPQGAGGAHPHGHHHHHGGGAGGHGGAPSGLSSLAQIVSAALQDVSGATTDAASAPTSAVPGA